jgi:Phytanoyl-CoA dioxygenase (PhyH)
MSKLRLRLGIRNTHRLASNVLYAVHKRYAKLRSRVAAAGSEVAVARRLADTGIAVLGVSDVAGLAELVEGEFESIPLVNGFAQLPRAQNPKVVPYLVRILHEHAAAIEACLGAHFRVNWFEVQKIAPGRQPAGSSFAYHSDDTPLPVLKLFVYLTDTTESNGAFRAFTYPHTDRLLRLGMLESVHPGQRRESAQALVPPEMEEFLTVVEGRKGTVFLFDNNLIHKGTLPRQGIRLHVSMELMPSPRPMTAADLMKGCDEEIKRYFPTNPFSP